MGWVLQDLMGASLMLLIMRQFRLPSIKVRAGALWRGTALLCLSRLPRPCLDAKRGTVGGSVQHWSLNDACCD